MRSTPIVYLNGIHVKERMGAVRMRTVCLALRKISQKWTMPIRDWKASLTRFTIQFGERISISC